MKTVAIQGSVRDNVGKKATKAIRKEGNVPCVIHGKEGAIHFSASEKSFKTLIYTPEFKVAEITIGDSTHRAIIKETQFHPVKDTLLHVDFVELYPGRVLKTQVPIKLIGSAPGVKVGGKLQKTMRYVKIKTTPESLVSSLNLDVSELELGKSIRVRDLELADGVEIMSPQGLPLAMVEIPRALRSAQAGAETATEE